LELAWDPTIRKLFGDYEFLKAVSPVIWSDEEDQVSNTTKVIRHQAWTSAACREHLNTLFAARKYQDLQGNITYESGSALVGGDPPCEIMDDPGRHWVLGPDHQAKAKARLVPPGEAAHKPALLVAPPAAEASKPALLAAQLVVVVFAC
jgi:hypothetical protein